MIPVGAGCISVTAVPNMSFLRSALGFDLIATSERLRRMKGHRSKSTAFEWSPYMGVTAPSR
jgi:hypothetical protein